jgi:hypothetical protein
MSENEASYANIVDDLGGKVVNAHLGIQTQLAIEVVHASLSSSAFLNKASKVFKRIIRYLNLIFFFK